MNWQHAAAVIALAPAMAFAQAPSDPQIAGIVVTANQIDVDAGKLAKSQSKRKDVQQFAQQMITDHTAVNKQAAADTAKKLKGLKGAQFDKAYVDNEVAFHQQVLDAIDKVLVPSAQNAELKALITKVRPAIAAHLEHAKHLQASVSAKK
jgi:putative membrane protein